MDKERTIDIQALQKDAGNSEHKEAYRVLDKSSSYRIGVGARLTSSGRPSFFLEVVVQSCLESSEVDLQLLEKNLMFLKELKARGYSLNYEGDGSIYCEVTVSPKNIASEYENIRLTIRNIFL